MQHTYNYASKLDLKLVVCGLHARRGGHGVVEVLVASVERDDWPRFMASSMAFFKLPLQYALSIHGSRPEAAEEPIAGVARGAQMSTNNLVAESTIDSRK
jgi:hypothetical protein